MMIVTGASGFVGRRIMQAYPDAIAAPSLREMNEEQIRVLIEESGADFIIHTAAISDIPTCQANPEASYRANVLLPVYLARAARGRKLICFSSDQVYSGCDQEGPYTEENVKPANTYAAHKIEMEQRVLDIAPDAVMLRAEWMYDGIAPKPNYFLNIVNAGETVAFSSAQYRGVTYLREVAESIEAVIRLPGGAYNYGSETTRSMYEITQEFLARLGKGTRLDDAPARHNLWMDCSKARAFGVDFSETLEGLLRCAKDYGFLG